MTAIALMITILIVSQYAFSIVVGVNLVFPLLIIYTYNLGFKKGTLIMAIFVLTRAILGLPILVAILWGWTFFILVLLAHIVNKTTSGNEYFAALYTFVYFMLFGLFASIQENIITGVPFYGYWAAGLPSDLLGAIAGFITTLVLLKPLSNVINQLQKELSYKSV